jgi:hypothetical protein
VLAQQPQEILEVRDAERHAVMIADVAARPTL